MLYMAVTPDEYELPIFITDSVNELSKITGVRANTIYSNISKKCSGRYCGMKFVKVEEGED